MAKTSKRTAWIIGSLIGIAVIFLTAKAMGWIGKPKLPKVAIEVAAQQDIVETVTANGKLQPEEEVKISPDVSGEITELLVEEGDSVRKGQLLLKINPELYITAVDRAMANLNNAKANLSSSKARRKQAEARLIEAETNYNRNKGLLDKKVISDQEFQQIKSVFLVAKAEAEAADDAIKAAVYTVSNAEAGLTESQKSLNRTSIYAPVDGIVSKLNIKRGERVVGTSQMAGTEMLRIANLLSMEVIVDVSENDIVRVKLGDTADVEVEPFKKRKFKGIVTSIANSANNLGATGGTSVSGDQITNFNVKIRILRSSYEDLTAALPPNQSPFRPGMSASVEIRTNAAKGVLAIPIEAVTTRMDTSAGKEPEEIVFVMDGDIVKKRAVKTGIQNDTYLEVLEGLKKDEKVVVAPFEAVSKKLKDGDKVEIVDRKHLFSTTKKED